MSLPPLALAIALLAAGLAGVAPEAAAEPAAGGIEIGYLNRTWTNLEGAVNPVEEGPFAVRMSSPERRITVHRNRLALAARAEGDPDARMEAEFEGEGQLVADVGGGRFATRFQDRVSAPRQSVRVEGRARVTRDAESYTVTLVDGPPSAPVRIQSDVIGEVVALCQDLGWLAPLDCDQLRASLSTVHVPLTGRERALRLPRAQLGAAERAYLDRFLAR